MRHVIPLPPLCVVMWSCLCLAALLPVPAQAARGGGTKTEVLPMEKAAPMPVVVEGTGSEQELRKQLRAKTGVGELAVPNTLFSQAPTSSFGFIPAQPLSMALVTRSPDLVIERVAPAVNAYEIHKLADGNGLLVGFIEREMIVQITAAQRLHPISLTLHSNPSEKAPYIAAVPLIKLVADRMPTRLDPKRPESPMLLTVDLQGTANRSKSLHGGQ